ncbi:MAG: hypothetical protein OHK0052_14040 [Anaerolineales bacterium]
MFTAQRAFFYLWLLVILSACRAPITPSATAPPAATATNTPQPSPTPAAPQATIRLLTTLGTARALTLQWQPDGSALAVGSASGVYLYAGEPLTQTAHIEPTCWTNTLAFSPNGETLALGCADGQIRLWQFSIGKTLQTLAGSSSSPNALAFSPDGHLLAYGRQDGSLAVWDTTAQQTRWQTVAHRGRVNGVAFSSGSADGLLQLASAGNDGRLRLWQADTGTQLGELAANDRALFTLAARPEPEGLPRLVASGGANTTLRLWDAQSGAPYLPLQAHSSAVRALAFSVDGLRLASGDANGVIWLWDGSNGTPLRGFQAHTGGIAALAYRAASSQLASLGEDGSVRLWQGQAELNADQATPPLLQTLDVFGAPATALAAAGSWVAVGDSSGAITLWNIASLQSVRKWVGHGSAVNALAFFPAGGLLLSGGSDGTLRVWDVTGKRNDALRVITAHTAPVWTVAISPDGGLLLSGGADGVVRRWEAVTGAPLGSVSLPGWAYTVSFAPNGTQIVAGGAESFLGVWQDFGQPSNVFRLNWQGQQVFALALRASDGLLAAAGDGGHLGLWQLDDAESVAEFAGETRRLTQVLFLGERWLAAAGERGAMTIWEVARPDAPVIQGEAGAAITGLAVIDTQNLPNGTFLVASGGSDGVVRIWEVVLP